MKSIILSILKSAPKFVANSSVNLHLEGWPAAVSVCGFSGTLLGIAYLTKKELEERRLSEGQKSVSNEEKFVPTSSDIKSDEVEE